MTRFLCSIFIILVVVTGCATNDYDYFGQEVRWTPYDQRYRRVEDYLRRRSPTASPAAPPKLSPASAAPPLQSPGK